MSLLIAIDGPVGVGKSTLLSLLKDDFCCVQEPVEKFELLPQFYAELASALPTGRLKYAFPLQYQVFLAQKAAIDKVWGTRPVIVEERGMWCSREIFVNNLKPRMTPGEFEVLTSHYEEWVKVPDVLILLEAPEEVILNRIRDRARPGEEEFSTDYLRSLMRKYSDLGRIHGNAIVVDADCSAGHVYSKVKLILQNLTIRNS